MTIANGSPNKAFRIAVPIVIFFVSLIGVYFISVYSAYFDSHKFLMPLDVVGLRVDLLGALIPTFISLSFAALYFLHKFSKAIAVVCFLFAVATAFFLGQPTNIGLMSNPATFSFIISSIAVFLLLLFSALKEKQDWKIRKEFLLPSLILAIACAPLAKFVVDLYYLPFFNSPVIGGNGLADGILLSTMYTPLTTIMAFSLCLFCVRLFSLTTNHNLEA